MHIHCNRSFFRLVVFFLALPQLFLPPQVHADPSPPADAPRYRLIALGVSGAGNLNNRGQLLGVDDNPDGTRRIFLWQDGKMVELKALFARAISADALSDTGVILGEMRTGAKERDEETGKMVPVEHRYAYDTRTHLLADLDTAAGQRRFTASGMASQVRWFDFRNGQDYLLDGGKTVALGNLSGKASAPSRVNRKGVVAGNLYIGTGGGAYHVYLWQDGKVTDIGTLPGYQDSNVRGLNDKGQVLGLALYDTMTEHRRQAFLWQAGKFQALPSLGGERVEPYSINNSGVAVGSSSFPGSGFSDHAVLWQGGKVYDLNDLVVPGSGVTLDVAFGINEQGWIVCEGIRLGKTLGVLLVPAASGVAAK